MSPPDLRLVAGAMTGTSLDGIDVALVAIKGKGLGMRARFLRGLTRPLGALAGPLRDLAEQRPMTAGAIARLASEFAATHADALRDVAGDDRLDLAAIHGQTVFHAPPLSWQLFTPAPVARALRCTVVHDLRAADLAHGGQGAPITPLADWILFRGDEARAVVNLGGFCNLTVLPADNADDMAIERIGGGDVCACNQVLDGIARARLGAPYDEDGRAALAAAADPVLVRDFAAALRTQSTARRSLGTGDELIAPLLAQSASHPAAVVARSACAAIAETIGAACASAGRVVLAGGGVRNQALVAELRARVGGTLCASDDLGIPATFREAVEMAVLGALCQDGVPITLPQITGVSVPAPVAGVWAYGEGVRKSGSPEVRKS